MQQDVLFFDDIEHTPSLAENLLKQRGLGVVARVLLDDHLFELVDARVGRGVGR